jgi:uncharacterized damage-inducible protein DinB
MTITPNALLVQMAHNNAWSNHRMHRAIGELSADDYRAPRTSFFPSLHETLTHILFVDLFYVDALEAGNRGTAIWVEHETFVRDGTFAQLRELQRAVDLRTIACATAPLTGDVCIVRGTADVREIRVDSRANVLLHLFQHQIHHRGQVHAMLAGTPVKPPQLDEFHLREDHDRRAQDLAELALSAPRAEPRQDE